jgi:hypothetical protein
LLQKARAGHIEVYFEGDSIARRWGATGSPELLANRNQSLFDWNTAEFGWGGDKTENILWRLENGELDGVNPKIIVLLVSLAVFRRAQIPAKEREYVVLKPIRDGAGVCTVINLKAVGDAIVVEDTVQLARIEP